jgi:hypothetical protein
MVTFCAALGSLVFGTRLYEALPGGDTVRLVSAGLVVGAVVYGILAAVLLKEWIAALVSTLCVLSVWGWSYAYARITSEPLVLTGAMYAVPALAALFTVVIRQNKLTAVMRGILIFSVIYCFIYFILVYEQTQGKFASAPTGGLFISADSSGRDSRIMLSTSWILPLMMSATAALTWRKMTTCLPIIGLCMAVLWLSHSRMATASILLVWTAFATMRSTKWLGLSVWWVFCLGSILSVSVGLFSSHNPLDGWANNPSVTARWHEVTVIQAQTIKHWVVGVGYAMTENGYWVLSMDKGFFPSDVGMLGILFVNGVAGVIVYLTVTYIACTSRHLLHRAGLSRSLRQGLTVGFIAMTLYSLQAPVFDASGKMFTALILGLISQKSEWTRFCTKIVGRLRTRSGHEKKAHAPEGPWSAIRSVTANRH